MQGSRRGTRRDRGGRLPVVPTRKYSDTALKVASLYREILDLLGAGGEKGLDVENTPLRVARMLEDELLASYRPGSLEDLRTRFTTFPTDGADEMVTLGPIPVVSVCGHHVLPFMGEAYVGYIPNKLLVGLSKIPRVVRFFSRKLQMQERLTKEIADFLTEELNPKGVVVLIEAVHLCMSCRGVETPGVITRTSALRGIAFTDPGVREEFYRLLGPKKV